MNDKQKGINGFSLLAATIVLYFVQHLMGCTLHVGMDWNGETSIDKRTFSEKESKHGKN